MKIVSFHKYIIFYYVERYQQHNVRVHLSCYIIWCCLGALKLNASFRPYSYIFATSVNSITFCYQFPQIHSSIRKAGHQFDSFMLTISLPLSIILRQVCDILLQSFEYTFFMCPQIIIHVYFFTGNIKDLHSSLVGYPLL